MAEVRALHREVMMGWGLQSLASVSSCEGPHDGSKGISAGTGGPAVEADASSARLSPGSVVCRLELLPMVNVTMEMMKGSGIGQLLKEMGEKCVDACRHTSVVAAAAKRVIESWKAQLKQAAAAATK